MKRFKLALILYVMLDVYFGGYCGGIFPLTSLAAAQSAAPPSYLSRVAGTFVASNYAYGIAPNIPAFKVVSGNAATGSQTITLNAGSFALPDGRQIYPFSGVGAYAPITIDVGSNAETVTPTAVSGCNSASQYASTCSITASFNNLHAAGVPIASGSVGLQEALNDAYLTNSSGVGMGGIVVVDSYWASLGGTDAILTAATPYSQVSIYNTRGGQINEWDVQPSTVSAIAAPAVRVATASCGGTTTVCDGTAVGTWTNAAQYVCVTYVDILGGESPCSTTAHYTSAGSLAINFTAPIASTGAVGWRAYIGLAYLTTTYQIPITSANCTLTTLESVIPACAVANTTYNQAGSNGVFPTPTTHTQLVPQSGGVANAYNPNTISHTTFAYAPVGNTKERFEANYGPFPATVALTAGQLGVLGTAPLPAGMLNYINRTIRISGKVVYTPTTGGTVPTFDVEIGDITDFSTGTPKVVCSFPEVHTTTTATYLANFTCDWNTQATGATGTIMPSGMLVDNVSGTLGISVSEVGGLAGITADVLDQDSIFIVFLQTSSAETTGPSLVDLHIETL